MEAERTERVRRLCDGLGELFHGLCFRCDMAREERREKSEIMFWIHGLCGQERARRGEEKQTTLVYYTLGVGGLQTACTDETQKEKTTKREDNDNGRTERKTGR